MKALKNDVLSPNQRMYLAGLLDRFEIHVLSGDEQAMINLLCRVGLDIKQARNYARKILADPRKYGYCEGGCLKKT